ncbi:MAG: hypothetical protein J1E00_06570 [Oscillospiraceae bacterium]|nr:hypothetical protein [Oscillospiraceae bacterium]
MNDRPLSPGRLLTHACYVLIIMISSFAIAQVVGTVLGWILHTDLLKDSNWDLSHNYYVVYPIRGAAALAVFLVAVYFFSRMHGYRVAFSLRETMTKSDFIIETVPAVVLADGLLYFFAMTFMPSWYLSGWLAALFKLIDPTDIYKVFGGVYLDPSETLEWITWKYYIWIQILFDVVIAVAAILLMRKGRRAGEVIAQKDHDKQLAEMRRESGLDK